MYNFLLPLDIVTAVSIGYRYSSFHWISLQQFEWTIFEGLIALFFYIEYFIIRFACATPTFYMEIPQNIVCLLIKDNAYHYSSLVWMDYIWRSCCPFTENISSKCLHEELLQFKCEFLILKVCMLSYYDMKTHISIR